MEIPTELPSILCGPLVRRASCKSVNIWLATAGSVRISVDIHLPSNCGISISVPERIEEVKLGQNFFVYLITLKPKNASFPEDTILAYAIAIDGERLDDLKDIALAGFDLPTFTISRENVNYLVGSCRKPHGEVGGTRGDALSNAWNILGKTPSDPISRPSTLLLLGDQIYADDVDVNLLSVIQRTAAAVVGSEPDIPVIGDPNKLHTGRRAEAVYRLGFTTGHGDSHLLSFGEYVAMYLIVFGGYYTAEFNGSSNVQSFLEECKAVRRLMANIVSYAMFDDHEITDDWFLDRDARENLNENPGARRVVANGLCAYWAFQGWGNNPAEFTDEFLEQVRDGFEEGEARDQLDSMIVGFSQWHFVTPTNPSVLFLDTRTQRKYTRILGRAELAGPNALGWLKTAISEQQSTSVFIASATPVLGYMPLEWLQGIAGKWLRKILTSSDIDFESWIAVRDGYFELMRSLLDCGVKKCVFLSGDVHYGFVKRGRFSHRGQVCEITQIVSSALRNSPPTGLMFFYMNVILGKRKEYRVGYIGNQLRNKLRRFFRAFPFDFLVFIRLLKPSTQRGDIWTDESELLDINGHDKRVVTDANIVLRNV